jgi:hypothetical protein
VRYESKQNILIHENLKGHDLTSSVASHPILTPL